jgi:hypothetical protein
MASSLRLFPEYRCVSVRIIAIIVVIIVVTIIIIIIM